ncbi:cytochrome P450 [Sphaerisporangium krabiense]|uniref:Cytochrome P450 n=1 Tax=Sphaerisporangium krabiense TaxID=763782 RepID=A0A7W8Z5N4_9ACTN|nr:cytochrome P450 [Sphaerisporangium krabiense]MBB5627942.1 cytochrome P450 [Sphaerisporangium krabiense]GII62102.1 cytochrome P450 [Sphaerisporangium krabiense]
MTSLAEGPALDLDLFSDAALTDPFPLYRRIRDTAPAVHLPRYGAWAMGRYADVRGALGDWESFSSARGIGLNDLANAATQGMIIATDPPEHDTLRNVLAARLSPKALRDLRADIERRADELVAPLVERGSFDAVADLARAFPIMIVLDLIGLPQDGRDKVLGWADAAFSASGPPGPRTDAAFPLLQDQLAYLSGIEPGALTPGSMGRAIYDAAAQGLIKQESCVPLMSAYVTAGLDTTINAISNAVYYFAEHPEQWDLVRQDPSLIPAALNEVLRIESPLQFFCRVATRDVELDGQTLAEGSRVMMLYASANRDERKWDDPERFDVRRNPVDHLAFGYGMHGCAGQGLARLEGHSVLAALARRVARFEVGTPRRRLNQLIRGLDALPTTVHAG